MTEGKPPKKYRVLVLKEKNTKQATWISTDDMRIHQLERAVGKFVLGSLRRFRLKCFEQGKVPNIEMRPVVLNEESMAALELDTWRCDLEEMLDDVEKGTQG